MSTDETAPGTVRKRTSSASPTSTAANMPPPRQSKPMKSVAPPLSSIRLSRLIYILVLLSTLLAAYYSYRIVQWKTDVGGWWNLAVGKRPPQLKSQGGFGGASGSSKGSRVRGRADAYDSVEDRINALADALGMPSKDLASAIAVAVREHVPPASLSSVAAQETGPAIEALTKGAEDGNQGGSPAKANVQDATGAVTGVVGGVVSGMENFVGMDEP